MLADVNNRLINPNLKPMDRSRYYNILISGTKLIHDMDKDATIEYLEERLAELEVQYKNMDWGFKCRSTN